MTTMTYEEAAEVNIRNLKVGNDEVIAAVATAYATLAVAEHTARLADAQETANLIAAFQTEGLLSPKERDSIHGRIGAALVDGRHG